MTSRKNTQSTDQSNLSKNNLLQLFLKNIPKDNPYSVQGCNKKILQKSTLDSTRQGHAEPPAAKSEQTEQRVPQSIKLEKTKMAALAKSRDKKFVC